MSQLESSTKQQIAESLSLQKSHFIEDFSWKRWELRKKKPNRRSKRPAKKSRKRKKILLCLPWRMFANIAGMNFETWFNPFCKKLNFISFCIIFWVFICKICYSSYAINTVIYYVIYYCTSFTFEMRKRSKYWRKILA